LVVTPNSDEMKASFTGTVSCPTGHPNCTLISSPRLVNDVIWQNRSFEIDLSRGMGTGQQSQQQIVTLAPALQQTSTGFCATTGPTGNVSYWDIGVRGDTTAAGGNGLGSGGSSLRLSPSHSFLSSGGYAGNNSGLPPGVAHQYCNGARVPPEWLANPDSDHGFQVPPGTNEANVPTPVFSLQPTATVDEGNNWVNMKWGPLALTAITDTGLNGTLLGDYRPASSASPTVGFIPRTGNPNSGDYGLAPATDFFGVVNRKANDCVDAGAVEFSAAGTCQTGGGGGGATLPTLSVLDNFNRANNLSLNPNAPAGVAWNTTTILGVQTIGIAGNAAATLTGGVSFFNGTLGTGPTYGTRQAAAFTFASTPSNNGGLFLKATGGTATAPTSYVRVRYTTAGGGTVTIATTTNGGTTFTTAATLTGFGNFANGDTLTAMVDQTGTVNVWKNSTFIGTGSTTFTGSGRIGMQIGALNGVDNFAGGNVP
jgi:hypothetical protein